MNQLSQWINDNLGINLYFQGKIVSTIGSILFILLLRSLVLKIILHREEDLKVRYQWRKSSGYFAACFGVILIGLIWFEGFRSLTTFLGLLSAGIAIALKDMIVNVVAWVFIVWRKPFKVGDRIEIGGLKGDVIDLRIFQFTLLEIGNWVDSDQSTGRLVQVPNGKVFIEATANYTLGFEYIWDEMPVLVTFESNWEKAKQILQKIVEHDAEKLSHTAQKELRQAAEKFLIFYHHLTPTVYTSVEDSGVLLTARYLCDPKKRRSTEQKIWEDILRAFAEEEDIDFAYPTQRFFNNLAEGKSFPKGER